MNYLDLSKDELAKERARVLKEYEKLKALKLNLNMARGKPSVEQLNLSRELLDVVNAESCCILKDGTDCLNYGVLDGISEIKKLFAPVLGVAPDQVFVGGNSSLSMMFDIISFFMTHGVPGFEPWTWQGKIKFLCPCPGYDRHFAILEHFNIEAIPVPMTITGPDMGIVENLVAKDRTIKGIFCVPKYSNPQGITYSDETVKRFSALATLAEDFRIFWDNAYAIHDLSDPPARLLNIMDECEKNGTQDLPLIFCSTSKITFPGAGVAFLGASKKNLSAIKNFYSAKTIGFDKINQLRHVRYFKDYRGLLSHMKKHQDILKPKFDLVTNALKSEFSGNKIISFTDPTGGYFISVDVMPGCAKRVVALCKNIGLILTDAGATFPYGIDKKDSNIRLAPSCPTLDELNVAIYAFCVAVKLATLEKLLES